MKVVVVVARGLRADLLGCYGNLWVSTPTLDALAADGVVFDSHFADRADPAGARRAWRSGLYRLTADTSHPAAFDLIAALNGAGVRTVLVTDGGRAPEAEFHSGWEKVVTAEPPPGSVDAIEETLVAAAKELKRLAARDDWLLWVELGSTLPPWDVPQEFRDPYFDESLLDDEEDGEDEDDDDAEEEAEEPEGAEEIPPLEPLPDPTPGRVDPADDELYLRVQSSYAAAVTYVDTGIAELLDRLSESGLNDDTLLIVTSDVGYPLGEHGVSGFAGSAPHEELIHLPLLVRLPHAEEAGRRVAALTQAIDLAPTLAVAFGVAAPETHGAILWSLLRGEAEAVRPYAVSAAGAARCLRTPGWALLKVGDAAASLLVKPDDRCEVNNVRQHHLEWAEYLERLLAEFIAASGRPGALEVPQLRRQDEIVAEGETRSEPGAVP